MLTFASLRRVLLFVALALAAGFPRAALATTTGDDARPTPPAPSPPSAAPAPAPEVRPVPPAPKTTAFGASVGGLALPSGVVGSGSASAAVVELDWVRGFGGGDMRLGFVGAYEQTSYQSSVNGFVVGRGNLYVGDGVYAIGFGAGLGFGSFSPTGNYHADDGGSGELALFVVPVLLRMGAKRNVELSFELGFTKLFSFGGETDPFGALSLGFVTW